ncbi:MAG: phosphatidate cytidylyltransferase [Bacteroidaceae bacterium]|nr:phosphatidate cytidylyltransferase [Bacteroidaceae bacterium]
MNTFLVRTLSGIVFAAILIGGIVGGPITYTLLFAAITAAMLWEFAVNVNTHLDASVNKLINTMAGVFLFVAIAGFCADMVPPRAFIPYLISIIYLLISELYLRASNPLKNWSLAFASQLYIALPLSTLNVLAFSFDRQAGQTYYNWVLPLSVFFFLWLNDTGAYCVGSLLSKRFPAKLFPRISPKKSWIGSIGGGLFVLLLAILLWHLFPTAMPIHRHGWLAGLSPAAQSLVEWIGLGIVVCVFGTWGDLVESLFKRQLGIKDSGNMMPGHGGILDRFDSSLLAIPAAVLYLYTLNF